MNTSRGRSASDAFEYQLSIKIPSIYDRDHAPDLNQVHATHHAGHNAVTYSHVSRTPFFCLGGLNKPRLIFFTDPFTERPRSPTRSKQTSTFILAGVFCIKVFPEHALNDIYQPLLKLQKCVLVFSMIPSAMIPHVFLTG